MDEKKMKAAAARKKYDAENMAILATKMNKAEAQAFRDLAAREGTTVGRKLSGYVRMELTLSEPQRTTVTAVLTAKNADRLKHETAFHNPGNMNPDQIMNHILDRYFKFVEEIRA